MPTFHAATLLLSTLFAAWAWQREWEGAQPRVSILSASTVVGVSCALCLLHLVRN